MPGANARSPARQSLIGVAACIDFLVAVQAKIEEIRRYILAMRPFSGRVCHYQCNIVLAQQLHEGFIDKTLVPNFDRVAQRTRGVYRQVHAAGHMGLPVSGKAEGLGGIAGQKREEPPHLFGIVTKAGWELPQDGAELFPQVENA